MQLVAREELSQGDVLGRTVFNSVGQLVVGAGFPLGERQLERLEGTGVGRIPVMELTDHEPPGELIRQVVHSRIEALVAVEKNNPLPAVPDAWQKDTIRDILSTHPTCVLADLSNATIDQLTQSIADAAQQHRITLHALPGKISEPSLLKGVRVAALALILAQTYGYPPRDRTALASAALVHDLGRILFEELAPATYRSSDLDRLLPYEHPTFAALILLGSDPSLQLEHKIIWQQAERVNGKGSPRGLHGSKDAPRAQRAASDGMMLPHTEILAVAIAVESWRHDPDEGVERPLLDVVTGFFQDDPPAYNTDVVDTYCQLIQRFPVGSRVKIKTNSSGKFLGFAGVVRGTVDRGNGHCVEEITITHDPHGNPIDPFSFDTQTESRLQLLWQNE